MGERRLLLSFFTSRELFDDPVRSLLTYLQGLDGPVRFADFPRDLYAASEELLRSPEPLCGTLELPDGQRTELMVAVGERTEGWRALVLDLGPAAALDRLVRGEVEALVTALGEIAGSGGRTLSADFAVLSSEAGDAPVPWHRQADARFEPADSLLLLWARITLWDAIAGLHDRAWRVERQWDGSFLIVPRPLREDSADEAAEIVALTDPRRYTKEASAALAMVLGGRVHELDAVLAIADPVEQQRELRRLLDAFEIDPEITQAVEAAGIEIHELAQRLLVGGDIDALASRGTEPSSPPGSALFEAIGDAHERRQALRSLVKERDAADEQILSVLRSALADADWEVRASAIVGAARLGARELVPLLRAVEVPRRGLEEADRRILLTMRKAALSMLGGRAVPAPPAHAELQAHLERCLAGADPERHDRAFLLVHALSEPLPTEVPRPSELPDGIVEHESGFRLRRSGLELAWIPPLPHWLGDEAEQEPRNPIRLVQLQEGFFVTLEPLPDARTSTWSEAVQACERLGELEGASIGLPSADEWELAARGPDGRRFPWGNGYEEGLLAFASPWGLREPVGVVAQWTSTPAGPEAMLVCGGPDRLPCAVRAPARGDDRAAVRPLVRIV